MTPQDEAIIKTAEYAVSATETLACARISRIVDVAPLSGDAKNGVQLMALSALAARLFARAVHSCSQTGGEKAMQHAGKVFESNYWQVFDALVKGGQG